VTTRSKPDSCRGCILRDHGSDFSKIEGTGSNGVMIVGEASGEHEQREGTPFVKYAPAGSLLERTFRRMGYDRQQFSITNAVRCRPRKNFLEPYEHAALSHCRPNLDAAIAERRPRAILALGGTALRELTGEAGHARGISHLAGYVLPGPNQIPVVPNFHPAFLRRGKAGYQGVFGRILQRAVNVAAGRDHDWLWGVIPEETSTHGTLQYQTHPSLADGEAFLERVRSNQGAVLSYDLETVESASLDEDAREGFTDTHISLIQFSIESSTGIALPWESGFIPIAQSLLLTPNTKCGHNVWLFDNKVLRAAGEREGLDLRPRGTIHDTLQMFHHWQPDLPAHLQFAAQFVQFPFPWKHLAGTDIAFYGVCDVDATLRLYTMLEKTLKRDGLWDDGVAA
jgi:uracil-DNA glycosylase family 4